MSIDLRGTPVLVVGAGIMGAGIVQVAALAGHHVQLFDMREGAAVQALDKLAATLKSLVDKGRLDAAAAQAAMSRMRKSGWKPWRISAGSPLACTPST